MERVAVVGPGGAGKSTFSERLGARLSLPVVHLDEAFWRPGWVAAPADEWRHWQEERFTAPRWIADGNYGGTFDLRFARADTVIVFQPPTWRCLHGSLHRAITNHGRAIQAPGCPERLDVPFLRWIWRYPRVGRPLVDAALARHADHLTVIELTSRDAAERFLREVPSPRHQ